LRAKIGDDAKDGAGHMSIWPSRPTKSAPILAATPAQASEYLMPMRGLARILAHGFVARLGHIPDMACGSLCALSQNRDSASRDSLC
jgi:hypothetical protein